MLTHFYKDVFCLFLFFSLVFLTISCGKAKDELKNRKEIEFEICKKEELPNELYAWIEKRKEKPFRFTYETSACVYLVTGYGRQKSEEYAVAVRAVCKTDNIIVVDTVLVNIAKLGEREAGMPEICPYIVLKCEKTESMVLFCSSME